MGITQGSALADSVTGAFGTNGILIVQGTQHSYLYVDVDADGNYVGNQDHLITVQNVTNLSTADIMFPI